MKNLSHWSFVLGTAVACVLSARSFAQTANSLDNMTNYSVPSSLNSSQNFQSNPNIRFGIVNTKKCLEESKLGKQEQGNFEKMKKQMESVLQEKEGALEDIESKLNDDDYMDSITDEAASELKRKKRAIRNEGMQLQNQYMQTLQQANLKIIQKLTEVISKASAQVATDTTMGQSFDAIFTDEALTFYSPRLDLSDQVIAKMNAIFDAEQKDSASKTR